MNPTVSSKPTVAQKLSTALLLGSLAIQGACGASSRGDQETSDVDQTKRVEKTATIQEILQRYGRCVYEHVPEGATRKVEFFRQMYGEVSQDSLFRSSREYLKAFVLHHDALFRANVALLNTYGSDNFRCLVFGYVGSYEQFSKRRLDPDGMELVHEINEQILQFGGTDSFWNGFVSRLQGAMSRNSKWGVEAMLKICQANDRFIAYCIKNDCTEVLIGSNTRELQRLPQEMRERALALGRKPSDQKIENFSRWYGTVLEERVRDNHYAIQRIINSLPEDMVVGIMLGALRSAHGVNSKKKPEHVSVPLEAVLAGVPKTAVRVWDESHLPVLFNNQYSNKKEVGWKNISADDVRLLIEEYRRRQ